MHSRHRRAFALLLAVPALAVGLAACGDDDGGGGGDALSASEYRTELKKICVDGKKKTDALQEPTGPDAGAIKKFLQEGLALTKESNEKLGDLNPPAELKSSHEDTVKVRDDLTGFLEELIGKIPDNADQAQLQQVLEPFQQRSDDYERRITDLAGKLGVPECAGD